MNRSKKIFAGNLFADHDRIFKVVSFPGHERHFKVTPERQLAIFGCISFGKKVSVLHPLSFLHGGTQVDTGFLVRFHELGKLVYLEVIFKAHQLLRFISFVAHMDLVGIHKFNHAIAVCMYLYTGITGRFSFKTGAYKPRLRHDQRNSLALHV